MICTIYTFISPTFNLCFSKSMPSFVFPPRLPGFEQRLNIVYNQGISSRHHSPRLPHVSAVAVSVLSTSSVIGIYLQRLIHSLADTAIGINQMPVFQCDRFMFPPHLWHSDFVHSSSCFDLL